MVTLVVTGIFLLIGFLFAWGAALEPIRDSAQGDTAEFHSVLGDSLPWMALAGVALVSGVSWMVFRATGSWRRATVTLSVGVALVAICFAYGMTKVNRELYPQRYPSGAAGQWP